jgi:plasmid stabilization system protein ParE
VEASRRVVLTERADAELQAAYHWLSQRDPAFADQWLAGFEAALHSLRENPDQHGFAPETGRYPVQLRQLLYGCSRSYRALFCIREETVTVMSIRHASQAPLVDLD